MPGISNNSHVTETTGGPAPDDLERIVRRIFELANRGLYAEALEYYDPDTKLDLAGSSAMDGRYSGKSRIGDLIEVAIKEYGQPRVRIDELHVVGPKVYVETSTRLADAKDAAAESREIHVLEFQEGKVHRHRVFTSTVPPPRLTAADD